MNSQTTTYLTRGLALALRIMEAREYCFDDAQMDFGMKFRTYGRWLARLRAAGMVFETQTGAQGHPVGYVRLVKVDVRMFSDASVAV